MKLNLGACDRHIPGFLSVDICPPADVVCDLAKDWPWPDSSVAEVAAYDLVEHLPDRIHTMNELWRVLEPGGRAVIETPNASKGAGYWQDPTHVTGWVLNSFQYFRHGSFAQHRLAKAYGIKASFKVLELTEKPVADEIEPVWKIRAVLEAVK